MGVGPIRDHKAWHQALEGIITQWPLCHYLLLMIETSAVWTPTCVHMIVGNRGNSSAVKWSPAHAEAIETGNGGRCGVMASKLSNLRILYFPQSLTHPPIPAVTHKHTHTRPTNPSPPRPPAPPSLEWRVWYQPICSNHPRNPNSLSSTTPDPRSSFPRSFPVCVTAERQPHQKHTAASAGPALAKRVSEKG